MGIGLDRMRSKVTEEAGWDGCNREDNRLENLGRGMMCVVGSAKEGRAGELLLGL